MQFTREHAGAPAQRATNDGYYTTGLNFADKTGPTLRELAIPRRSAADRMGIRASLVPLAAALAIGCADSPAGPGGAEPRLTLELRFLDPVTPTQRTVFNAAVEKWTSALYKDMGDIRLNSPANQCFSGAPPLDETRNNPLVLVSITDFDGPGTEIGYAGICKVGAGHGLPMLSHILIDRADIASYEANGFLPRLVTHELGHALGFISTVYMPKSLAGATNTNDPFFNGSSARAEFLKTGSWYSGPIVPLQNYFQEIGPHDPHWRYSVFGDEIMSGGWSGDPAVTLSSVTLGLFKDLGYKVDFSVADPYIVAPVSRTERRVPAFSFRGDVRMAHLR